MTFVGAHAEYAGSNPKHSDKDVNSARRQSHAVKKVYPPDTATICILVFLASLRCRASACVRDSPFLRAPPKKESIRNPMIT